MDKKRFFLFVAVLFVVWACSSMPDVIVPELSKRTLRISLDVPGFEYQWRKCVKPGLFGNCREWQTVKDLYDLRIEATRSQLINMGFVAKVRDNPVP